MKFLKPLLTILLTGITCSVFSQPVIVGAGVKLPKDSVLSRQLVSSLNSLLAQRSKPAKDNTCILKDELSATSILLNELKDQEKNPGLKDDNFYKLYLQNVASLGNNNYLLQLAFMGINNGQPVVRLSFRLIAKKADSGFYFYSPFMQAVKGWKLKKLGNISFYYADTINMGDAKSYYNAVSLDDKKLNAQTLPISLYYCSNFVQVQQLLGIDYKLDYNSLSADELTAHENNSLLVINGGSTYPHRFDTHDLFHERLRQVVSYSIINRPVDEGCAYLYGGSWGVYKWPDIIALFKKYAAEHPDADWLTLYINEKNKNFVDGQTPLKISYAINALIAQKYDKEHGLAPMSLLTCGKPEKGDENYFAALEKLTGISKASFNAEVWKLIKAEK